MTNEEAIERLTFLKGGFCDAIERLTFLKSGFCTETEEALRMAIEALSDEAVSREDTVTLNSPISIQTEMVAVVRCKDCRHCSEYFDKDGYPYWICDEWDGGTDADGFCHYGERRKG